jgi:hypothetical protein
VSYRAYSNFQAILKLIALGAVITMLACVFYGIADYLGVL